MCLCGDRDYVATSSTLYLILLHTQNCSKKLSLKNNSCRMAKANHLFRGNHEADKGHVVDSVGVGLKRTGNPVTEGFTADGMQEMLPRPRRAQHPGRRKAKGKGGFAL